MPTKDATPGGPGAFLCSSGDSAENAGALLLDGDNRGLPEHEVRADGLVVLRWERYESESYLVHPEALLRFVRSRLPLFPGQAERYLRDQLPPAVYREPLQTTDFLRATPASKTLLPGLFDAAGLQVGKKEFYLVAEQMTPEEVPSEVKEKLDAIHQALGLVEGERQGC